MTLPAFIGGMPGGMELAIVVLNLVLLAAIVYAIVSGVRSLAGRSDGDLERRVANLEGQVEALREELREREVD
jgi:hypothetical protein